MGKHLLSRAHTDSRQINRGRTDKLRAHSRAHMVSHQPHSRDHTVKVHPNSNKHTVVGRVTAALLSNKVTAGALQLHKVVTASRPTAVNKVNSCRL